MLDSAMGLLGSFTVPIEIHTNIPSLFWMFPLLGSIALIYKATKMRVFHLGPFFKQAVVLFLTISLFMVVAGAALILIVNLFT